MKLTLEHCTEGQLAAERFAAEGYPMAVGPSLTHASKFELRNKTFATPGILARAGCARLHHHRFAGDPAALPAAVCGAGRQERHGPL